MQDGRLDPAMLIGAYRVGGKWFPKVLTFGGEFSEGEESSESLSADSEILYAFISVEGREKSLRVDIGMHQLILFF